MLINNAAFFFGGVNFWAKQRLPLLLVVGPVGVDGAPAAGGRGTSNSGRGGSAIGSRAKEGGRDSTSGNSAGGGSAGGSGDMEGGIGGSGSSGSEVDPKSRVLDVLWDKVIDASAQLMVTVLKLARLQHAPLLESVEFDAETMQPVKKVRWSVMYS
jgi:hypothetical protein